MKTVKGNNTSRSGVNQKQQTAGQNSAADHTAKKKGSTPSSSRKRLLIVGAIALIAAALGLTFLFSGHSFKEGREKLDALASRDVNSIAAQIQDAKREELNQLMAQGADGVATMMADAVVIGDSRAKGFEDYGFMPDERVMAGIGDRVTKAETWKDAVAALKPSVIYFAYGANDLPSQVGADQNPDGYAKVCEQQADILLEQSPDATIVFNSIVEPAAWKREQEGFWANMDDYNRQLKELCERRGWIYVDNSTLTDGGNAPIYEPDGEHFIASFYGPWAQNMTLQLLDQS